MVVWKPVEGAGASEEWAEDCTSNSRRQVWRRVFGAENMRQLSDGRGGRQRPNRLLFGADPDPDRDPGPGPGPGPVHPGLVTPPTHPHPSLHSTGAGLHYHNGPRRTTRRIAAAPRCRAGKTSYGAYAALLLRTMSRPVSEASHAAASTRLAHARSLSVKTNTASAAVKHQPQLQHQQHQPPNPILTSHVRLFLTNLRLLDLDLRSDWPNITTQTFSAKNADQKQRISGTEWALFRLFEIWDPTETAQVRVF